MFNMGILLLFMIVNFVLVTASYKLFGKKGLVVYMVISVIAANIQVNKELQMFGPIEFLGLNIGFATLGNVMFSGIFLTTDLLNEKYGAKETKNAIYLSIAANFIFVLVMAISVLFDGFVFDYNESVDRTDAFNYFFNVSGPIFLAMLVGNGVYFISQLIDVMLYQKIRSIKPSGKFLWLRNNGSTLISQFVDTILITFGFIVIGIIPGEYFLDIVITTLLIKYLIALLDTPFIYLLNKIKPINE